MAGMTFVNQVGAIGGMNQAAPGTLIPDTFVRFAQDVLFDRAGFIRRRGPFKAFTMYNSDNTVNTTAFKEDNATDEYVLSVVSTFDPNGVPRIGMIINSVNGTNIKTIIRVFDKQLKFLGEELLFSNNSNTFTVTNKVLTSNVATLTIGTHAIQVGDAITVTGVDSVFNGSFRVTAVTSTTISYARVNANVTSAVATGSVVANMSSDYIENLPVVSCKQALGGGLWLSFAATPGGNVDGTSTGSDRHYQFFWRGGYNGLAPASGPITKTDCVFATTQDGFANGHGTLNKEITLNTSGLYAGMFVYASVNGSDYYIGTVKTVNATKVTLEKYPFMWNSNITSNSTSSSASGSLGDATYTSSYTNATLKFTSVRPYEHLHGRGTITTASTSTPNVTSGIEGTSGEGHWSSANVINWYLYRASDNAWMGKVKTITSNTAIVLEDAAGIQVTGEDYVMKPIRATVLTGTSAAAFSSIVYNRTSDDFAGLYTAVYAGYQWYGNMANQDIDVNRVVFSASHNREAVDLSLNSADSIVFPGKSQFRGMGAASTGLLVFLEDRTYILRGNDRTNFSVEQLYPEGCLCASSIVEYGGGVFWAGKSGILFYDGASVRNMTKDNLGLYYTDALDVFNPELDRVISYVHKNNLIVTFTSFKSPFTPVRYEPIYAADWLTTDAIKNRTWQEFDSNFSYEDFFTQNNTPIYWDLQTLNDPVASGATGLPLKWDDGSPSLWQNTSNIYKYGPLRKNTSMTFSIYLPTNALTTLSNMDFRGAANIETTNGLKTLIGVNSVESGSLRARLIDIHPVYDINTNGQDAYTIEKINIPNTALIKGPDFYIQTKHYTMGNPILRKWFQRIMLSMLLYDGCLRLDLVDDDDNDAINIDKKKHQYWEVFTEEGYTWDYLGRGGPPEGDPTGQVDFGVVFPKLTSPNKSTWDNVEQAQVAWGDLFLSDFNRYKMRTSWRQPSVGFRLYQLNNYKKPFNGTVTRPDRIEIQSFTLGFKPLREGRQ